MNEIKAELSVQDTGIEIKDNLGEIEAAVKAQCDAYMTLVYRDEKDCKNSLAMFCKEKKSLDSQRIDIKKDWMRPYDAWETKAKEIIALYDKPIEKAKAELEEYEAERQAEKREKILDLYEKCSEKAVVVVPLESIADEKWFNKTCKLKDIEADIKRAFEMAELRARVEKITVTCEVPVTELALFKDYCKDAGIAINYELEFK